MNITFLTPPYDVIERAYGSKSRIRYGNQPPLGILYMIAELRRHGHRAQLLDASAVSMSVDEISDKITGFETDLIGISTMTPSAPSAYDLVRALKKRADIPTVLGGVHANSFRQQVLEDVPELDMVCIGEGEQTIVDIVRGMAGKLAQENVKWICYRDENRSIVTTDPRPLNEDLDTLALPARDVLDNGLYRLIPLSFKQEPVTSMISSRGCPYGRCSFCFEAGNRAFKYRRHSPEHVIREIEDTVIANGIREVAFWDDYFLINRKWISRFCELLTPIADEHGLTWSCYGYPKTATREMLQQVARAGCWAVLYGFEAGDQNLLDVVNKGISLDDSRNAARWTHEAGMDTRASFMLALPGETPALAKKTVRFAIELNCTMAQFLPTFPEPGTPLYDVAREKGQIGEFRSRMKAVYVPEGYKDAAEVDKMVRWAYLRFYLRFGFFIKHLRRIRSFRDFKHYLNALRFFVGLIKNTFT